VGHWEYSEEFFTEVDCEKAVFWRILCEFFKVSAYIRC
jgi:hypothetical protein